MLADLVQLDEAQIAVVEPILSPLKREGRTLTADPAMTVVGPPGKTNA